MSSRLIKASSLLTSSSSSSSDPYPTKEELTSDKKKKQEQQNEIVRQAFLTFDPKTVALKPSNPDEKGVKPFEIIKLDKENCILVINHLPFEFLTLVEKCLRDAEYCFKMFKMYDKEIAVRRYDRNLAPRTPGHPLVYSHGGKKNVCHLFSDSDSEAFVQALAIMRETAPELFAGRNFNFPSYGVYNTYDHRLPGSGAIAAHSDNEFERFKTYDPLNQDTFWWLVFSVSMGMTRRVVIRRKPNIKQESLDGAVRQDPLDVVVRHGSLFAMIGPTFQARYTHAIPDLTEKEKLKWGPATTRISATFRAFSREEPQQ